MSESTSLPPFLKWGDYKSKDQNNPDIVELQVLDATPFATEYSTNVRAKVKRDQAWREEIVPLKSHGSNNASLLTKWTAMVNKGKIKAGTHCTIKTHLGISKNNNPIRRFAIELR